MSNPEAGDPLDDALADLRVSGSVLLHEAYPPGWAIAVPDEAALRGLIAAPAGARAVPFHLVRRGGCEVASADARMTLAEPELSLVTGGAAHRLSDGARATAVPLVDILSGNGPPTAPFGSPGTAELVCGAFLLRATPVNPLLGAIPPMFKVAAGGEEASPALAGVATVLAAVLGRRARGGYTTELLLEALCAEAIRAWVERAPANGAGWLSGLAEPKVSEAIRMIHAAPAEPWSVERLAGRVALSPSRFAARFREAAGESVMAYVARWRSAVACRLLRESELPLAEVAARTGYESLPAFSRAFKAQLGTPPGAWRDAERSRSS
jgi:AraC-like DNA-binding protein